MRELDCLKMEECGDYNAVGEMGKMTLRGRETTWMVSRRV